jgi:hypothetical protein
VVIIAHGLFPGGVEIPFEEGNYDMQVKLTQDAIARGVETLYEAAFNYDGVFVKGDLLRKGKTGCELYEVKSSTGFKDIIMSSRERHCGTGDRDDQERVYLVPTVQEPCRRQTHYYCLYC